MTPIDTHTALIGISAVQTPEEAWLAMKSLWVMALEGPRPMPQNLVDFFEREKPSSSEIVTELALCDFNGFVDAYDMPPHSAITVENNEAGSMVINIDLSKIPAGVSKLRCRVHVVKE